MTRKIEVTGIQQAHLENIYHKKIHEINAQLKALNEKYNNWDTVDERLKERYTREEYKRFFIDNKRTERSGYVLKLKNIRNGFVLE